jgi:hypothetical protein
MKRSRIAALALLAACSAACSQKSESAAPAREVGVHAAAHAPLETQPKALMRTIFPSGHIVEDNVSFGIVHASGKGEYHLMMLASTKTFADGRLVAVVSGARCGADGDPESEHGASTVNVYTLRQQDGTWQVVERHEQVADTGTFGDGGDVKWVALGPGKEGFVVSSQYWDIDMNAIHGDADVFELAGGVRHLGGIPQMQDVARGCAPEHGVCTDAQGLLHVADEPVDGPYRDLVLDFTGRRYTVTTNGDEEGPDKVEHLQAQLRESARYRFNGEGFVLVSGSTPLPGP